MTVAKLIISGKETCKPGANLLKITSLLYQLFELYNDADLSEEQYHKFGIALQQQFEIITDKIANS